VVGRAWRDYDNFYDIVAVQYDQDSVTSAPASRAPGAVPLVAFPNPCNPATTISFSLPSAVTVTLEVLDLRGRRVATPFTGRLARGDHAVIWRGTDQSGRRAASGTYVLRLQAGTSVSTSRVTLVE
jgi:hypothetical protein